MPELEEALAADNRSPEICLAIRPGIAEVAELIRAGAQPSPLLAFRGSLARRPGPASTGP